MYGDDYSGNGVVVALLALNLLVTAFAFPYSRSLFVLQAARLDTLVNIVAMASLFTFGIAAVKRTARLVPPPLWYLVQLLLPQFGCSLLSAQHKLPRRLDRRLLRCLGLLT